MTQESPQSPLPPQPPAVRKRHGCLTAIIIVFGILTFLASVINLLMSGKLAEANPNAPPWAATGILIMGLMGLVGVAGYVAVWYWKKVGLYLCAAMALVALVLNLAMAMYTGVLGLVGLALIMIFVLRQWKDFE